MKFPQIAVGQRFVFRGDHYVKISPLLARAEASGQSQVIPRSAQVEPLETATAADTPHHPTQDALDEFHRAALACLEALAAVSAAAPQALSQARKQLAQAHRHALARLSRRD